MLYVALSWAWGAQGRSDDTSALGLGSGVLGIDGGCQSKEEEGSGEGLEEHLDNEWMKVRRMAAGARDRLCRTGPLRKRD
jgi:hypothetical protein